jgi:hypothetical protein
LDLAGSSVTFHLKAEGQSDFGRLVSKKGFFQALVLSSDELGAWVVFPGLNEKQAGKTPVMLVKWEHVSWAVFEYEDAAPEVKKEIGFVPHRSGN